MNINKLFWDINEISEKYSVNASKVRFYEKEFDLEIQRNRAGDRQFTKQDIEKLNKIFYLVEEQGFTLERAKELFKKREKFIPEKERLIESLGRFKEILQEMLVQEQNFENI